MQGEGQERRGTERFVMALPATACHRQEDGEAVTISGTTRDVSESGLFLRADSTLPLDEEVEVSMTLRFSRIQEIADRVTTVTTRGRVVRLERDGMGIRFDKHCTVIGR